MNDAFTKIFLIFLDHLVLSGQKFTCMKGITSPYKVCDIRGLLWWY